MNDINISGNIKENQAYLNLVENVGYILNLIWLIESSSEYEWLNLESSKVYLEFVTGQQAIH